MNVLETLTQAEAVVDLLRVNLAGDFCGELPTNAGLTLIEAKQDSGVAACELVAYLIREARRDITARFAEHVASAPVKKPRKCKPAAPVPHAENGTNRRLHAVMDSITLAP
jgi:hypothetical protein